MGAIGEKIADYTGTGHVSNADGDRHRSQCRGRSRAVRHLPVYGNVRSGGGSRPGETGPLTGRVQDFRPDGSVVPQVVTGSVAQEGAPPVGSEGDQHGRRREVPFLRRSVGFGDAVDHGHDLRLGLGFIASKTRRR